jgi:CheY-like chemotaxis protein
VSESRVPRALAVIEQNAEAQLRLVEDMLDVSRIVKGTFRLDTKPTSLSAAIEAAVETVRPAAAARQIALSVDADPDADRVRGDAARLQQAVWNVLSNAIKFTPTGGRVAVIVRRAGPLIEVEVSDTGEGIEADVLPFIFDRFRQGDSGMNRSHMGLGLGLAIVRHILEMHGGRAQVKSEGRGKGATFTLSLPALEYERPEAAAARPLGAPESDGALNGLSVLLVEDDADAREMLAELLATKGVRVVATENVQDGLAALDREGPDVVLSDIAMPGDDGFELIRQIRQRPGGRNLPALAISAYSRAEDRSRSLASGFQRHIAKPVNAADLFDALSELTGR